MIRKLAILATACALSACQTATSTTPAATSSGTATTSTTSTSTTTVNLGTEIVTGLANITADTKVACTDLATGKTVLQAVDPSLATSLTQHNASTVSAITAICAIANMVPAPASAKPATTLVQ